MASRQQIASQVSNAGHPDGEQPSSLARPKCATAGLIVWIACVFPLIPLFLWQTASGRRLAFHQHHAEAFYLYAVIAPLYDNVLNPPHWTTPMRDESLQHANFTGTASLDVLDCGAGTGFTTEGVVKALSQGGEALRASKVTMLDQSPHQLHQASMKPFLSNIEKLLGDSHVLPDGWTNRFDRYVSAGSIEYWPDPARALREAFRVVKPGGRATIIGPVRAQGFLSRVMCDLWYLFPDESEYFQWFRDAGFRDVKAVPIMPEWVSPGDRLAHGLIMGFTVTGVKPVDAEIPSPEAPLPIEASRAQQQQSGLLSLCGVAGVRFVAGSYGAAYYAVLPLYVWFRHIVGATLDRLVDGLVGLLAGLSGWFLLINPFLSVGEPWLSTPHKGACSLVALYELARPHTIRGTVLAVLTGYVVAATYSHAHAQWAFARMMVSAVLVNVYVVAVNQLTDVSIDSVSKPWLPIPAGKMSWRSAKAVTGFCFVSCSIIGAMEGSCWFCTLQYVAWIGTFYSVPPLRLKRNPFIAAFSISSSRAIVGTLGCFFSLKSAFRIELHNDMAIAQMLFSFVAVLFVFSSVIAWMKDVPDIEGDRVGGVHTFAMVIGPRRMTLACIGVLSLMYGYICAIAIYQPFPIHAPSLFLSHLAALLVLHARTWTRLAQADDDGAYTEIYVDVIWPLFYFEFLAFPGSCVLQLMHEQVLTAVGPFDAFIHLSGIFGDPRLFGALVAVLVTVWPFQQSKGEDRLQSDGWLPLKFLLKLIQMSRPGFWHFTAALFFLAAAKDPSKLLEARAILGLLFVVFPLNLLVYSMNDFNDVDIDAKNPRKGGWFGAQASETDLRIGMIIGAVSCLIFAPLLTNDFAWATLWNMAVIAVNWLYNFGPQLSRVLVLDMVPPLGYILCVPFASKVLGLPHLDPIFYSYITILTLRTQLWFQRMDQEADSNVKKVTTAVFLGSLRAALAVVSLLVAELAVALSWGCTAGIAFTSYCMFVLAVEFMVGGKHRTTEILVPLGCIATGFWFWRCLAE